MKSSTRKIYNVASNPYFIIIAGACSIIALALWLYEKYDKDYTKLTNLKIAIVEGSQYFSETGAIVLLFLFSIFLVGFVYSLRVRWENMSLRGMSRIFYEINLLYKEQLQKAFLGSSPISEIRSLVDAESAVLRAVCQRIAKIYTLAIGRPCVVTIKLVRIEGAAIFAQTYVRSEDRSLRDKSGTKYFNLGTGENSSLDTAVLLSGSALPCHYFSADLTKEKNYCNQRQHYDIYYKSVLLVPIRGEDDADQPASSEQDLVGFLCVDTMSTNRLNDSYHLYMLAALSHQMYNFIALMRGRYSITHGANYVNHQGSNGSKRAQA